MQVSPVRQGQRLARSADAQAHATARQNRDWLIPLGRFGHAALGVVYALVAVLALQAALGTGGETTDTYGALLHIIQAPSGLLALAATAIGLTGYALWRFLEAVLDTDGRGTDPKGLVERVGALVSAVTYAGLAVSAANLLRGQASGGEEQATQDRTAWLLSQPFGPWLVALAGLVVIGVGLAQFYLAYTGSFRDCLEQHRMTAAQHSWVDRLGRFGFAARGVVFCIVGGFLVMAGASADPQQARGLGGVLAAVAEQPLGQWLLGVIAAGLLGYAVFLLAQARFRRMLIR